MRGAGGRRLVLGLVVALMAAVPARAATLVPVGTFRSPVFVTSPPGDVHRLFVVEQPGTIRIVKDGVVVPAPFLDLSPAGANMVENAGTEQGLLSMAFAPDFATNGRFDVYYTALAPPAAKPGDIQVDEFRVSATDSDRADLGTRRPILAIGHPTFANHNGGQLAYGPDGMLWLATGDGAVSANAQNASSLLGKVLRIDPRPGAARIPRDNPFARGGGAPQVWASGLRNPFRFSFDRATGDLVIADVGQAFDEEVDFVPLGRGRAANFGWDAVEGSYRTSPATPDNLQPATADQLPRRYFPPTIEHLHGAGWCAVIGGYVVRDPGLPDLFGRYVYSDLCLGHIFSAALIPGGTVGDGPIGLTVTSPTSFGEDACGRLYVTSATGAVLRLQGSPACTKPVAPFVLPPSARDTTGPRLRLIAGPQRALARGVLAVSARCGEPCRLTVSGSLRAGGRTLALGTAHRRLAGGRAAVLRLAVRAPARSPLRRSLTRADSGVATLRFLAVDGAGNRTRRTLRVRVIR